MLWNPTIKRFPKKKYQKVCWFSHLAVFIIFLLWFHKILIKPASILINFINLSIESDSIQSIAIQCVDSENISHWFMYPIELNEIELEYNPNRRYARYRLVIFLPKKILNKIKTHWHDAASISSPQLSTNYWTHVEYVRAIWSLRRKHGCWFFSALRFGLDSFRRIYPFPCVRACIYESICCSPY